LKYCKFTDDNDCSTLAAVCPFGAIWLQDWTPSREGVIFILQLFDAGGIVVLGRWFKRSKNKYQHEIETKIDLKKLPKHIAIIMDGNGRWARKRGLPRTFGHRAGVESLREVVRSASDMGIKALTVYAFSTENWKRPEEEVNILMTLFSEYLDSEIEELHRKQIRIQFIGRTEELADSLQRKIWQAQLKTENNAGMIFSLAVNYGGRTEIIRSCRLIAERILQGEVQPAQINEQLIQENLYTANLPELDLLIRPSGDYRISNFLLWQIAYAEFWFTDVNWPDFTPAHLLQAIESFQQRDRRFGGLK
jgi:undecaprenyl diphosphate synthase